MQCWILFYSVFVTGLKDFLFAWCFCIAKGLSTHCWVYAESTLLCIRLCSNVETADLEISLYANIIDFIWFHIKRVIFCVHLVYKNRITFFIVKKTATLFFTYCSLMQRLCFQAKSFLIGQMTKTIVISQTPQACVRNIMPLTFCS